MTAPAREEMVCDVCGSARLADSAVLLFVGPDAFPICAVCAGQRKALWDEFCKVAELLAAAAVVVDGLSKRLNKGGA